MYYYYHERLNEVANAY